MSTIPQRLRTWADRLLADDHIEYATLADEMRQVADELAAPAADAEHAALRFMRLLSEDARTDVMSNFCKHCGSDNPSCQCWNDE